MLSAAAVRVRAFTVTKLREGYDQSSVDLVLDKVSSTLAQLEAGLITGIGGASLLTPSDVLNQRFPITKFRDGYEMGEVDDFLDDVTYTLTEYVQRATRGALQPLEAATGDSSAISVPTAHENLVSDLPSGSAAAAAVAAAAAASAAASASADPTATGSGPAPSDAPHPDALTGDEFMRKLQSTRATMFGAARESLTFRAPDGRVLSAVSVERTDDGLIVHLG